MNTLEQFELFLVQGGKRKSSTTVYTTVYRRVEKAIGEDFQKEKVDSYLLSLQRQGIKPRSLNMVVAVVHLYARCFKRSDLSDYPFFKRPKYSERVKMTDEEIEAFLALPPKTVTYKNKYGGISQLTYSNGYATWTLFYSILAFTGMRPAELAQMTLERVDLTQRIFTLREEDVKTKEPRIVPIPDRTYDPLYSYIKTLTGDYLFPSKSGGVDMSGLTCVNATDWGYNFSQRLKRLEIKRKGLSVYSLRHSIITRLLDEDVNLYKVQNLVGHKNIATTAIYYHSSTKALKETVRKDPITRKSTPQENVLSQYIGQTYKFFDGDDRFVISIDRNTDGHLKLDIKYD